MIPSYLQKYPMKKVLFLLSISIVFISCNSDDDGGILTELTENRQLWESTQVTTYFWTENISCFCGGVLERRLLVIGDNKNSVEFDESLLSPGQTAEDILNDTNSVQEAFALIESIMNQNPASLIVEYDSQYGFPTLISVDFSENIADDEIVYSYTNFEFPLIGN